jgi:hypothetical protein
VHGSDVDNTATIALLDHLPRCELRAEEGALEVDREHFFVLFLGGIKHRSACLDAGVINHDVQAPKPLHRRVDEGSQFGDLAHIRLHTDDLIAQRRDLLLQRFGRLWMRNIVDDDTRALFRQFEDNRQADSAVSGDDGYFAF